VHAQNDASVPVNRQVPSWSAQDEEFFLHGSMSTEVVPESVLRAFIRTYPDLFPTPDLSHLGLIPDPAFGWPIGFSRANVKHLGGLSSVGVNCAACHVAEITSANGGANVRVLGVTSHFNAEAFFGAMTVAGFRTVDSHNMKKFLSAYLAVSDPGAGAAGEKLFQSQWEKQEKQIVQAIAADPSGSKSTGAGGLNEIDGASLRLDNATLVHGIDLAALSSSMLKLFHNMRAALHIPDAPPKELPPASGPGRNDAFGLLSASLFGVPQPYAPVKYGVVWNLSNRPWVHWDGNTRSPIGRNLLASVGLGAPLVGKQAWLDYKLTQRHTVLSQQITAPKYPFAIDQAAAKRGAAIYQTNCASCHEGQEGDSRLHAPAEIGTDPRRAQFFTPLQADRFNKFLAGLQTAGYTPSEQPGLRSTQKYWAPSLAGVWARSPYLHNGSVRTMQELLTPPELRAKSFHRGSRVYDPRDIGYKDDGYYVFDTTQTGNSNAGHSYGTNLAVEQKRDLIEYLKTR
jgi:mono/diheme cytochrome c family protein